MKHWYYIVRCVQCKVKIPVKYLGTGDPQPPTFPPIRAAVFSLTCQTCGARADYTSGDLRAGPLYMQIPGFTDLIS
jgi:hypothetical protein